MLSQIRHSLAQRWGRRVTMTFADLALAPALLQALTEEGYVSPTLIQAQSIPMLLQGRYMLGMAQTGTGKTAAFALPLLHRLAADPCPAPKNGARILAPTRKLVSQIAAGFEGFGRYLKPRVTTVFGGVSPFHQANALKDGEDILVAAPGRLLDLIEQGLCDLSALEHWCSMRPTRCSTWALPADRAHCRHAADRSAYAAVFGNHGQIDHCAGREYPARSGACRDRSAVDHRRADRAVRDVP